MKKRTRDAKCNYYLHEKGKKINKHSRSGPPGCWLGKADHKPSNPQTPTMPHKNNQKIDILVDFMEDCMTVLNKIKYIILRQSQPYPPDRDSDR
jgi:hypothetical protein